MKQHTLKIFLSMGEDAKWYFIQRCSKKERNIIEKWANNLDKYNCSFIHFAAKDFYLKLIQFSKR